MQLVQPESPGKPKYSTIMRSRSIDRHMHSRRWCSHSVAGFHTHHCSETCTVKGKLPRCVIHCPQTRLLQLRLSSENSTSFSTCMAAAGTWGMLRSLPKLLKPHAYMLPGQGKTCRAYTQQPPPLVVWQTECSACTRPLLLHLKMSAVRELVPTQCCVKRMVSSVHPR